MMALTTCIMMVTLFDDDADIYANNHGINGNCDYDIDDNDYWQL